MRVCVCVCGTFEGLVWSVTQQNISYRECEAAHNLKICVHVFVCVCLLAHQAERIKSGFGVLKMNKRSARLHVLPNRIGVCWVSVCVCVWDDNTARCSTNAQTHVPTLSPIGHEFCIITHTRTKHARDFLLIRSIIMHPRVETAHAHVHLYNNHTHTQAHTQPVLSDTANSFSSPDE